jgi:hypothetical protein
MWLMGSLKVSSGPFRFDHDCRGDIENRAGGGQSVSP